jgi:membrane fusion protein (multidrug efflux system)
MSSHNDLENPSMDHSEAGDVRMERRPANPAVESQGSAERRPNGRFKFALISGLILIVLVGATLYAHFQNRVSTDDAQVDGHIDTVSAKVSGNITDVLVDFNQPVKAGQVLTRLDARDYQVRADQARAALALAESQAQSARVAVSMTQETTLSVTSGTEAQLAASEAEYERAKVALDQASTADLSFARANVENKQASYDRAVSDLARMKVLIAKSEISQQQYDSYTATAREAESDLKAAREKLASSEKGAEIAKLAVQAAKARVEQARAAMLNSRANQKSVAMRTADAASAAASVAEARANLEAADLQLSYTILRAPIDGIVTKKSVEVGQVVQPGQPLLSIIPLNDIWVTANFKETQLSKVRPGDKAEIFVDMYGKSFSGHVDSIAASTGGRLSLLPPENATGNFVKVVQRIPVKIVLDAAANGAILRPGMNVDATVFTR